MTESRCQSRVVRDQWVSTGSWNEDSSGPGAGWVDMIAKTALQEGRLRGGHLKKGNKEV